MVWESRAVTCATFICVVYKDLAAQLPPGIGDFLRLARSKDNFALQEFYRRVNEREGAGVDLPQAIHHAKSVMAVLHEAVSPGEMNQVRGQLPAEYNQLFELVGEPA